MAAIGRVLVIAGSDSGGGAGIQADIKTITALGGYAMTAVTALTAQNTQGVFGVHAAPPAFVARQIEVTLSDLGADAIKIGMLGNPEIVAVVADTLAAHAPGVPIVLDPVMIAKGGAALLTDEAVETLRARLLPMAALVTPNAPEAARLWGRPVETLEHQKQAARALSAFGARAVLVKGGHLPGKVVEDVLWTGCEEVVFRSPRIESRATHGTGCTLASAIAARIAGGARLEDAVAEARAYLREAILRAPGFGTGHGPLDHAWPLRRI